MIHLVMPFSRLGLKDVLLNAYRPMDIILHPIMFLDEKTDFNESWVEPFVIPMFNNDCDALMIGPYKRNWFITHHEINDNDYYVTVDDDDMYEDGVFDKIKTLNDDIIIISMKRGQHIPEGIKPIRMYPTSTLVACPENVRVCSISTQQSFVKGKIFRGHLFDDEYHYSDGLMAVHHKNDGEQIRYEPDLYALFNYYEPGRWD